VKCKTKPISGGEPLGGGRTNKPNLPPPDGRRGRRWSLLRQTNPICPPCREMGAAGQPYEQSQFGAPSQPGADCAKQTQSGGASWRTGTDYAKRTQFGAARAVPAGQFCQTKPIPAVGRGCQGAKCAKRTQFLPLCRSGDRRSREGQMRQTNPNLSKLGYLENETRDEGQMRKTNPVSGRDRAAAAPRPSGLARAKRIVQNKANLHPVRPIQWPGIRHRMPATPSDGAAALTCRSSRVQCCFWV
jgi:hypothetical protein